jgi:hypothetical protein
MCKKCRTKNDVCSLTAKTATVKATQVTDDKDGFTVVLNEKNVKKHGNGEKKRCSKACFSVTIRFQQT